MPPDISIIICTRNRGVRVASTLESIFDNTYHHFEVIVIDQSTNGITKEAVQRFFADPRFHYKKTDTKGLSIARNIGISEAHGSIIAFTDDDCRVAETWVEEIVKGFEKHPSIASIFGKIIPEKFSNYAGIDHNFNHSQAKRLQLILPIAKKDESMHQLYKDDHYNLGFGHGANMCFCRSVFSQYGGFDEFLSAGAGLGAWEDRDIGYRILSGGGQILYLPDVVVYHDHWREWPEVKRSFKYYGLGVGTAVSKYIRSGDWGSIYLLFDWMFQLGLRQLFSGIFKWQSLKKTYIGFFQLIYPCIGLIKGLKYPIDPEKKIYVNKK